MLTIVRYVAMCADCLCVYSFFIMSALLSDNYLWTGSTDRTIRVWEITSGQCVGVLSCAGTPDTPGLGHTEPVSCLELIPASPTPTGEGAEPYIASGGADGDLKLWRTNGEFVHCVSHGPQAFITAMKYYKDDHGGTCAHNSSHL
jgi:WD40 repeat protein